MTTPEGPTLRHADRPWLNDRKFKKYVDETTASLSEDERASADYSDDAMREEYELFKKTESVESGLKKMWPDHIQESLGIKLGKEGTEVIHAYLRKEMRENPDAIDALGEQLETFRTQRERIRELESRVDTERGKAPDLQLAIHHAETQKRHYEAQVKKAGIMSRLFGPNHRANVEALNKAQRDKVAAEAQLRTAQEAADNATSELEEERAKESEARDEITKGLLQETTIAKMVREKVEKKMEKMLTAKSRGFGSIEKMSELNKKYAEFAEAAENEDDLAPEEVADKLDNLAEKRAREGVKKAINNIKESTRFSSFVKNLKEFVMMNPIGSKEREDAQEFVREVFEERMEALDAEVRAGKKGALMKRAMLEALASDAEEYFEELNDAGT